MTTLAQDLWEARREGHVISPLRDDLPTSSAAAYDIQDSVVALSGLTRCGYKVGSTSKEAQVLLGTDEPACAPLLTPFVTTSPARLSLVDAQMPAIEGEFAFRLGRDLPARDGAYTMAEVTAAIDAIAGAVEIVGTRFEGGLPGKGRFLTTADCGVNIGLVLGAWTPFDGQDLRDHPVAVRINGAPQGAGTGHRALGDPRNVLHWLANSLSERGRGLRTGDIVATGTCTGLDPVRSGDAVRVDFATLGHLDITF